MKLRKVVREKVVEYFNGPEWMKAVKSMAAGRDKVYHAHIYADSVLHPSSVSSIVEDYFAVQERPLERKLKLLSHGKGLTNVYYIQPRDMCHFEVFLRYDKDVVLVPTAGKHARSGRSYEDWGPEFMEKYYSRFEFREMNQHARDQVKDYFASPSWESIYRVMALDNERNVHSHCLVETSLHPEEILPIGAQAIERKGWMLDRGVSVVFGLNGYDQGKITYLVKSPELVLELEWEYNKDVVIKAVTDYPARITTTSMVEKDMESVDYIHLENDDFEWISQRIKKIL